MPEFDIYNDDTGLPDPLPPDPLPIPPPESGGFEDPTEGEDKAYYAIDAEAEGLLEPTLISPIPESQDDTIGSTDDYGNLIGSDDSTESETLTGPFDAWVGEVLTVHYGSSDPIYGLAQVIEVMKCATDYGANNDPLPGLDSIGVHGDDTSPIVLARPFPVRHDQVEYHVKEGDIVTVVTARDGKHYFFSDDLSFIGTVEGEGTNSGSGDGLTSVRVRRQYIAGDPAALELGDLLDSGGTEIEYDDVWIVDENEAEQGYETDDRILVHRRGSFLFAAPKGGGASEMLFAKIVTPASYVGGGGELLWSTANPCDSDGGNVDEETTLYLYHRWLNNITSNEMAPIPHLVTDDVRAYLPFEYDPQDDSVMESCGIIQGDVCLPEGPFTDDSDENKPLQMNDLGQVVIDWLIARDPGA